MKEVERGGEREKFQAFKHVENCSVADGYSIVRYSSLKLMQPVFSRQGFNSCFLENFKRQTLKGSKFFHGDGNCQALLNKKMILIKEHCHEISFFNFNEMFSD